ncbi:MAG: CoA pyrophosphatase, partial [Pseudohongiellaceae bacterium]
QTILFSQEPITNKQPRDRAMAAESQSPPRFEHLLSYFQAASMADPAPIPHPDADVNRLLQDSRQSLRHAAVLIPVTRQREGHNSQVVLTVRSENLRSHAGQISLPGGSWEEQDVDPIATALRESEEEIGLERHRVDVIGKLGDMALPSGFRITPIVGVIDDGIDFVPCPIEVADIFQVPLDVLLDTRAYRNSVMTYNDQPRKILEVLYEDYRIWGATAAILFHLAEQIERMAAENARI